MRHSIYRLSRFAPFVAACGFVSAPIAFCQTQPPVRLAQQPPTSAPAGASQAPGANRPVGAGRMVPVRQNRGPAAPKNPQPAPNGAGAPATGGGSQWNPGPTQIAPVKPRLPFRLTAEEEKQLDETLKKWEEKSDKIQSFKCELRRWEYDIAYGARQDQYMRSESKGVLKYKAPDHGVFHITATTDIVPQGDGKPSLHKKIEATELDHWVCDGESIFQIDATKKTLIQTKLPPEMRGKAIADGPLPFVFGAKAEQIKRRYFIRIVTPDDERGKQVWLEAWPKYQTDAANFQRVTVILTEPEFLPYGLQVFMPGPNLQPDGAPLPDSQRNRTVYLFDRPNINDPLIRLKGDFWPPIVPPTWKKKIVEEPPAEEPPTASTPPVAPAPQAKRPAGLKLLR